MIDIVGCILAFFPLKCILSQSKNPMTKFKHSYGVFHLTKLSSSMKLSNACLLCRIALPHREEKEKAATFTRHSIALYSNASIMQAQKLSDHIETKANTARLTT